jgi:hypothetical protein
MKTENSIEKEIQKKKRKNSLKYESCIYSF